MNRPDNSLGGGAVLNKVFVKSGKNRTLKQLAVFSFILFLTVSFLLPFFSFKGYSVLSNTTSHLGAQGSPYAWVMNTVFILLGIMTILHTGRTGSLYSRIFGLIFGLSLALTGVFQHAPLAESVQVVNQFHDLLHSIFATATGFSFTIFAAGHAFMSRGAQRIAAVALAVIAIAVPLIMFGIPSVMGITQRFMFIAAFYWLFFYYKPQVMET